MKYTFRFIMDHNTDDEIHVTLDLRRRKEKDLLSEFLQELEHVSNEDLEALRDAIDADGYEGLVEHLKDDPQTLRAALRPYNTGLDRTEVSKAMVNAIDHRLEE